MKRMKRLMKLGLTSMEITNEMKDIKLKWKVITLIERLAGPTIGIYCFNLFPFTNYEFYQYIVAAS